MGVAEKAALLSRDNQFQVGAVIVKNDSILSFGYNGTPAGWDNETRDENGITKPCVIHAEENAIMKMAREGISAKDSVIFTTWSPCLGCARMIYNSGIKKVYYTHEYPSTKGRDFLTECGIEMEHIQ